MTSHPSRGASLGGAGRFQGGHASTSSTSSGVSPRLPGADYFPDGSRHRPSASIDRAAAQYAAAPMPTRTYSDASIPPSPSLSISNSNFPTNYHGAGYGQRGVKHSGVFGLSRHFDDNASVASLIMDREDMSDSGHTFSTHEQHMSNLSLPGLTSEMGRRVLREKTSYTHLKNSDHKIPSNEEKYNAYMDPSEKHYDGPEPDDALHDPGPRLKGKGPDRRLGDSRYIHGSTRFASWRGWLNVIGILCIIIPLVGFFAAYPIVSYVLKITNPTSMYTNSTGQVPAIAGFRALIDMDTPAEALTKMGQDGNEYTLVFSDEFNVDGRSFYDGDDPFFTAGRQHYYGTGDVEFYDPQSATTAGGNLVLNLSHVADPRTNYNFSYMSAMVSSWNQFCFTGGIIEARVSLPGRTGVTGLWPAFWTLGNLGRAGYGSTLEGMWPYSYDACDSGALPNQTNLKRGDEVWQTSWNAPLSFQPGQKLSACTCSGEDHPGPHTSRGRGVPELDVIEALINVGTGVGEVSQTMQIAPYDPDYIWTNTSATYSMTDTWETALNEYHGGVYQQSCSALSNTDQRSYYYVDRDSFETYGVEYKPSQGTDYDGYMYWTQNGTTAWMMQESGLAGRPEIDISQRLVPREPMYMIMNLGMSESFNHIDYDELVFPAIMRFDWIRVYQQTGQTNIGCDPPDYPTADYIQRHINAYTNYNLTIWEDAEPSGFPKNSLLNDC